jgi:hypothetical protein
MKEAAIWYFLLFFGGLAVGQSVGKSRWERDNPPPNVRDPSYKTWTEQRGRFADRWAIYGACIGVGIAASVMWRLTGKAPGSEAIEPLKGGLNTIGGVNEPVPNDYQDFARDEAIHEILRGVGFVGLGLGFAASLVLVIAAAIPIVRNWQMPPPQAEPVAWVFVAFVYVKDFALLLLCPPFVGWMMFTGTACLFAPTAFYRGPIGQKYLRFIGARSIFGARFACLLVLALLVGIVYAVVGSWWKQ